MKDKLIDFIKSTGNYVLGDKECLFPENIANEYIAKGFAVPSKPDDKKK